jgi:hypothetical protein
MAVAVGAGIKRGLFDDDPVFGSPSPSKRVRGVSVASVVGGSGPSPLRAGAQFNPFSASPDHNLVQLAQLCALFPDMDPQVSRAPSSSRFHSGSAALALPVRGSSEASRIPSILSNASPVPSRA